MLKKAYDSPEMEITRINFQAIMEEENRMDTSGGEVGAHSGDTGLDE